jgi:hypothetical protein
MSELPSALIRGRIAAGQPISLLVPAEIESALAEEGLVASPRTRSPRKDPSRPRSS